MELHTLEVLARFLLSNWKPALEIFLIYLALYGALRFLRGTRGEGIFKGLAVLTVVVITFVVLITQKLQLDRVNFLLGRLLAASVFALIIIFQPELRRGLVRLGQNPLFANFFPSEGGVIEEVVEAVTRMARNRVGVLIALERETGLRTYIEGGLAMDAEVRAKLLETIFFPGTPLHDGAVIIRGDRIAAAGCLFPLSENPEMVKGLGTRHRAGVGLSEETDALTIMVSEETGQISVAVGGKLERDVDRDTLETFLRSRYLGSTPDEVVLPPIIARSSQN